MKFFSTIAVVAGLINAADQPDEAVAIKNGEGLATYMVKFLGKEYRFDNSERGKWDSLVDALDAFGKQLRLKSVTASQSATAIPVQNQLNSYRLDVPRIVNSWCPDVDDLCDRVQRVALAYVDDSFCSSFQNWLDASACLPYKAVDYTKAHLALFHHHH